MRFSYSIKDILLFIQMAVAFMLAPYGHLRFMSSFAFTDPSQGPSANSDGIISPEIVNGECVNGQICAQRAADLSHGPISQPGKRKKIENWWNNGNNQIAFSCGAKGFVAINAEGDLREQLQTGLPAGIYCDVITGGVVDAAESTCWRRWYCYHRDSIKRIGSVLAVSTQMSASDKEKDNKVYDSII